MDFLKKHAYLIVAGILVSHFVLGLVISSQESMIYDERAHIPAAYSYVRYGDMRLNPEHPPLLKDLAGLPLLAFNLSFPLASPEWQTGTNEQWTVGDMFVNCSNPEMSCNNADTILFWSRLPITLVAVLLGIAIFLWTRELSGTLAGLFAVTLYAFDPNIIAHNHYVTTDIGIATFLFLAFYFFVRFLKNPSYTNIITAGLFLGFAEVTKFSAVLLFPLFGLFVILYALTKEKRPTDRRTVSLFKMQTLFEYVLKFGGSVVVCFILIWSLYAWNTINMPGEKIVASADFYLSQQNAPAIFIHDLIVNTSENAFLKPLSQYILGAGMIFARVASGNPHYFLGEVTMDPSRWYFPVVFILKETLPFLMLLSFALIYTLSRIGKVLLRTKKQTLFSFISQSIQQKPAQYLIFGFILLYSVVSINGKLNIGFRHLFPLLPFLYMLIAKTVFDFWRHLKKNESTQKLFSILFSGIIFSIISIPILAYPNYLSYFNIAVGGHSNGYKYVTDSNYDWGQDLKRVQRFIDIHNRCKTGQVDLWESKECIVTVDYPSINKIRIDYFGGSNPGTMFDDVFIPWWGEREPEAGWYAISSFFYQESLYKKKPIGTRDYSWLEDYTPVTRVGDSFFIYYIPEKR
ncbi:MAG: glycosyltransferase family 39 protein [Candidatus Moranbacteria bacterium]|nr:glycosyltransferase family 39 protein [Candidatus Moranbacteria bacterium]MDD3965146.1 glycosyltransferase family 39 protein [Candidatus Moranbacteria bacterium]